MSATMDECMRTLSVEALFSESYAEILELARSKLTRERTDISICALVHELYLNLQHHSDLRFTTRQEFLAYANRAMRSLLIDWARERSAEKRTGQMLSLTEAADVPDAGGTPEQLAALDEVIEGLSSIDTRLGRIVEMRLRGLKVEKIAADLGVSEPTIKRDWQRAKNYLCRAIESVE